MSESCSYERTVLVAMDKTSQDRDNEAVNSIRFGILSSCCCVVCPFHKTHFRVQ